jgi:AcrR family transcriptional regulator
MAKSEKDIRDIIIDVARGLFAKFGFKKTTMDEIAQAVHKGKSSLYHYFKSKEEVFQAVVEKESVLLKEEIRKALETVEAPMDQIRTYVLTRLNALKRLTNFYSAIMDEYFEHYDFIEKMRARHYDEEIETFKAILKKGVDEGIFYIKELDMMAFAFVTALKGFELKWITSGEIDKVEKSIHSLFEVLFYGILKR